MLLIDRPESRFNPNKCSLYWKLLRLDARRIQSKSILELNASEGAARDPHTVHASECVANHATIIHGTSRLPVYAVNHSNFCHAPPKTATGPPAYYLVFSAQHHMWLCRGSYNNPSNWFDAEAAQPGASGRQDTGQIGQQPMADGLRSRYARGYT